MLNNRKKKFAFASLLLVLVAAVLLATNAKQYIARTFFIVKSLSQYGLTIEAKDVTVEVQRPFIIIGSKNGKYAVAKYYDFSGNKILVEQIKDNQNKVSSLIEIGVLTEFSSFNECFVYEYSAEIENVADLMFLHKSSMVKGSIWQGDNPISPKEACKILKVP
ncbi:hypothetical protein FX988_00183 [Paraglaciecola mesophila]|uniref:Uncharacterized protein n=1 Tax=Paraglaciecola mesophila TaxID=197222 RepID=A0A857JH19_9ALTE|nr:hypothetical protein [Paraglaciecola mesophila]QHJ09974.1 hypothetical protein FX988_00183 [Paraglaciecola mesophila]